MGRKVLFLALSLLVLLGSVFSAQGQTSELNQIGTSMANFLKIAVGARASAMGGAFVALSDDISSLYWNPGGLGMLRHNSAIFQSTNWLLDTKFYFAGVSFYLANRGTVGLSLSSFSSGDILETTIYQPDGTGRKFDAGNFMAAATYSRQITDRFSAGLTLRYVTERLDREKAATVAIDVGSVFITNFLNNMRIGFALSNLGGRMTLSGTDLTVQYLMPPGTKYARAQLGTDPWDIPLLIRFGVATDAVRTDRFRLTLATEVLDTRDYDYRIATGAELALMNHVFLRGGYKFHFEEENFSFGGGFTAATPGGVGIQFDYAFVNHKILDHSQMFSIILSF